VEEKNMGEIARMIRDIQNDKNNFVKLMDRMYPLVKKYTRLLYKDEQEDIEAEMILALWEAILKIEYCEDDGKCMTYICNALKNRFYELYRKSKKQHNNLVESDAMDLETIVDNRREFEEKNFLIDMENYLKDFDNKKRMIYTDIILENKSDAEIGEVYQVSRQYVNRQRKELYKMMRNTYFK